MLGKTLCVINLIIVSLTTFGLIAKHSVSAAECQTNVITIQPRQGVADDEKEYTMINILGFVQNATTVHCLADQPCKKGKCQQDYKLHQFLTVPAGRTQFEINELQFRFFKIPYGCKCGT